MSFDPHPPLHLPPLQVAADTFLIRSAQPALGAPLSVHINSLVIRGEQPVLVDTGSVADRAAWLEDVFQLVDPDEVRWVFISHDDADHTGNLAQVLEACPQAVAVTSWAGTERSACTIGIPPHRLRWVHDGEALDAGDRRLVAIQPPVYDSPATRGVYDPTTGVYWASDAFATPMPSHLVERVDDLPADMWQEGMAVFQHHALAPWLRIVDRNAYAGSVARIRNLDPQVIVACHTPLIAGDAIRRAFDHLLALPDVTPPPHPDQGALEAALAGAGPGRVTG